MKIDTRMWFCRVRDSRGARHMSWTSFLFTKKKSNIPPVFLYCKSRVCDKGDGSARFVESVFSVTTMTQKGNSDHLNETWVLYASFEFPEWLLRLPNLSESRVTPVTTHTTCERAIQWAISRKRPAEYVLTRLEWEERYTAHLESSADTENDSFRTCDLIKV